MSEIRPTRRALLATTAATTVAGAITFATPAGAAARPRNRSPWPRQQPVTTRGDAFVVGGKTWRFGGTNCYYLATASTYMIDSVLNDAEAMSMASVRAGAFSDGDRDDALQSAPYIYEEDRFASLDYAVYKAGQLGIRLVLQLVNNWPAYGGMQQYVKWFLDLEDDSYGAAVNHDRFYTDPAIRRCFTAYVAHVINRRNRYTGLRYRDDPTIMTWELANEPRNRSDPSGRAVLEWADDLSRFIKRQAPHQLVAVGDEGMGLRTGDADYPYSTYEGNRWLQLSALRAVDYATVHLYPQDWGRNPESGVDPVSWGTEWIREHIRLGRTRLRKPVVVEEFGLEIEASTGIADVAARDRGYDTWLDTIEQERGAGFQFWLLTALTDAGVPYEDYDGFRVTYPSSTAFLITSHAKALRALAK